MRKLKFLIFVFIFSFHINVFAKADINLAIRLAKASGAAERTQNRVKRVFEFIKSRDKDKALHEKYLSESNYAKVYYNEIKIVYEFYMDNFTEEEIKELIELHKSPALHKFTRRSSFFHKWYRKKHPDTPRALQKLRADYRNELKQKIRKK